MQKRFFSVLFSVLAMLAIGSAAPDAKKDAGKAAAGPRTAKDAYFAMYKGAREWAPDVQVLSVKSEVVPGQKVEGGKAAGWTVVFASTAKMETRTITWALDAFGNNRKGMNPGQPVRWGGPTTKAKPFSMTEVTLDSDEAQKKAAADPKGAAWIAGHAGAPVSFYLGADQRFTAPVWVITHGSAKEGYIKAINAATGADAK